MAVISLSAVVEESEEAVDTAIREIREETGYKNVRFVSETPAAIEHHYFAHSKMSREESTA